MDHINNLELGQINQRSNVGTSYGSYKLLYLINFLKIYIYIYFMI